MEFNIDPNTTLISGITPLMIASSFGNADVLDCLLEAEADVNITDQDGYSPLTYAVTGNTSLHIVQFLLEAGANPNILVGCVPIVERAREKGEQTTCDLLKYSALHLHKRFIHLVDRIQEGIDTLIKGGKDILFQVTQQLETNFHLTGLASKVQTSINLFNQLTPYYDFLNFEMLVTMEREFLKGDIENELEVYHVMATKFEELVEIHKFKDVLSLLPQQEVMPSTSCSELTFKLNRQWGNLTLKSFRRLYSYLFSDSQLYISHMTVDIVEEVPCVKFPIPKSTLVVECLISEVTKKKESMHLLGVFEMMIDNVPVLTEDENENFTFDSALLESSQSGNNEAVQFLLDLAVNVNRRTALIQASQRGHYQVEILLKNGADPNIHDNEGWTTLIVSSHNGHQQIVELLLEKQVDPNVQNSINGRTALIQASQQGHYQVVEILLKNGADPNLHDNRGWTVVHLLIKAGADLNITITATSMGLSDIEKIESNLSIGLIPQSVSFLAKKILEVMKAVLQQNPNSIISYEGMNALNLAVILNQVNTAKRLLEAGANPNVKVQLLGVLPLMMANISGDVKAQKQEPSTSMMACARGVVEMVKLLLRFETDVNATNEFGVTALVSTICGKCINNPKIHIPKKFQMMIMKGLLGSENAYLTIIELLLEAQNPPIDINDGQKALMMASCIGDVEVVEVLLKKHIDANVQDESGFTPLMMSCEEGHIQVVQQLLNHGAELMTTDEEGFNALDAVTIGCKDIQIIDCLLDWVADEHKQSYISRGLHNACLQGCSHVISHLN